MDVVAVACPSCAAEYRVKVENVGRKAKCTKCGKTFVLTAPNARVPATARPDSSALIACRYCGFQDSGNFCSNCGGRLTGEPQFDLEGCKVPQTYLSRFPAHQNIDFDAPPQKREEEQRRYEIRQRCERFNEELNEMARVIKYKGVEEADWHFDRLKVGRLVDSLPLDVPGRDAIVSRLWTIVSDMERTMERKKAEEEAAAAKEETEEDEEATRQAIEDGEEDVQQALETEDLKKAEKALHQFRQLIGDAADGAKATLVAELESGLELLRLKKHNDRQCAAFQKLLDKADKLAFLQESKKAVKAYQECLFWLSRNDVPQKNRLQQETEQKLQVVLGKGAA